MAVTLRRGEGKGRAFKEKMNFFNSFTDGEKKMRLSLGSTETQHKIQDLLVTTGTWIRSSSATPVLHSLPSPYIIIEQQI